MSVLKLGSSDLCRSGIYRTAIFKSGTWRCVSMIAFKAVPAKAKVFVTSQRGKVTPSLSNNGGDANERSQSFTPHSPARNRGPRFSLAL